MSQSRINTRHVNCSTDRRGGAGRAERAVTGAHTTNTQPRRHVNPTLNASQVDKAEQDRQSAVIKAQGEAQSAKLIGEAIATNPAFLTLRRIEARAPPRALID